MTVTVSPFFKLPTVSPFMPACPRRCKISDVTVAGPGTSETVGSEIFFTGLAAFFFGSAFFLAGAGVLGFALSVAAGAAVAGAGTSGRVFVFTCATALVAIIVPRINQQFVFINLMLK